LADTVETPGAPGTPPSAPSPEVTPPAKPATTPKARTRTKPAGTPSAEKPVAPKVEKAAKAPSKAPPTPKVPTPAPAVVPKGTVVDVSGLVLGRAASAIAFRLLRGESIVVVNAEKSVVTGSRSNILSFYTANRARGSKRMGPHYPRYPDRIFRRTVRGMLPHLKTRGKEALDRLEVFIGVPADISAAPRQSIEVARSRPALRPPMTLQEITRLLGARL